MTAPFPYAMGKGQEEVWEQPEVCLAGIDRVLPQRSHGLLISEFRHCNGSRRLARE
jgi:hypothetical protein